ncbi:ATP-binding protein [Bowmanella sp. JS7-9]|uniref:histidine kinase n=1 Tax=Pseudobowmanella zhangzhouensis TaxID=1537679 RepID=A0ABW1XN08_9ALTE|nr:ATP-binding protein [Bowmanella sp. JS7-9]
MKSLFVRFYLFALLTFIALGWSIDKLYDVYSQQTAHTSDVDLHRGTFFLVNRELARYPAEQQQIYLDAFSSSFGYGIHVASAAQLPALLQDAQLSVEQTQYLQEGGIVSVFSDTDGASWYLQQRMDADDFIVFGPIFNDVGSGVEALMSLFVLGGLALVVFVWAWPISHGIITINRAAEQFGQGNLDARAPRRLTSTLQPLAQRFNAMAARIQALITSHKTLSHAVSHELKTPIARIRFAHEMLKDAENESDRTRYLQRIDESIEELNALVEELLVYARFDRETPVLHREQNDFAVLAEMVLTRYRETHPALRYQLRCEADCPTVNTDKSAMLRILDNLIRNAVRYACSEVQIRLLPFERGVEIQVHDDGIGIPEAEREAIFEPFVRLDKSRDRASGGIGLGLSIVKRYVELQGGSITISQSPLGGALFVLRFH